MAISIPPSVSISGTVRPDSLLNATTRSSTLWIARAIEATPIDLTTRGEERVLFEGNHALRHTALVDDSSLLVAATTDGRITTFDLDEGGAIARIPSWFIEVPAVNQARSLRGAIRICGI